MNEVYSNWSWCPVCQYWVPAQFMNADLDPVDNTLVRICNACLAEQGGEIEAGFVRRPHNYDPSHEKVQCCYCDSYDTESLPEPHKYKCHNCKEIFILW